MMRPLFLVLASALLVASCTSPKKRPQEDPRLNTDVRTFDQTEGSGWRPLIQERRFEDAARLIAAYLEKHRNLNADEKALLYFHRAQLLAVQGEKREAIKEFKNAYAAPGSALPGSWNSFVEASISFLRRDRKKLEQISNSLAEAGNKDYLPAVQTLLRDFDKPYAAILFPN